MKQMHMKHMNVRRHSWSVSEHCLPNGSRWKIWNEFIPEFHEAHPGWSRARTPPKVS